MITTNNTNAVALADVDGNGGLDLLVGNGTNASPQINQLYRNDGAGSFTAEDISAES